MRGRHVGPHLLHPQHCRTSPSLCTGPTQRFSECGLQTLRGSLCPCGGLFS